MLHIGQCGAGERKWGWVGLGAEWGRGVGAGIAQTRRRDTQGQSGSPVLFFADVSKMIALIDSAYCFAVASETTRCSERSDLLHAIARTRCSSTFDCSSRTHSLSFSNDPSSVMEKTRIAATAPR